MMQLDDFAAGSVPQTFAAVQLPVRGSDAVLRRPPPVWKRVMDVVGAATALILLSPLLLLVAAYIKIVSPGPVLYRQYRLGHGAKEFLIYKFRTMHLAPAGEAERTHSQYVSGLAASGGPARKPCYQGRLIRGGGLLRALSLDELPQLLNVLRGEMSLIGPRPDVLALHQYQPWQLRRFEVLPGISGLWQVSGKNSLTFEQMIRLDIEYVDTISLRRDLAIIGRTVPVVISLAND